MLTPFRKLNQEEELVFRKWARDNYEIYSEILGLWHPVVQHECATMNLEYYHKTAKEDENVENYETDQRSSTEVQ